MYSIGDKIVHPAHGAGIVEDIIEKKEASVQRQYYQFKIPVGNILMMIPTDNADSIGVRPVIQDNEAEAVLESLGDVEITMNANWTKRYNENLNLIKSGDISEVAKVVKGLISRDRQRGLSTGERKLLHSAKQILISEIVFAQNTSFEAVEKRINSTIAS